MAQQVRQLGAIPDIGLVAGHRVDMAGVHEDHVHESFKALI